MSKSLYMHTINGRPAYYNDGEQIVYLLKYHRVKFEDMFVDSLAVIRRQQTLSNQWRAERGYEVEQDYDYVRILRPEG